MFRRVLVCLACGWCLSGCMIVQVGVTNPMPELTTIAVAPFFNQSSERAIDGRRVALAYASELQKIPGVEVIPVGVVETRMREKGLQQLSGPEDALKLAEWLNADAVVIGSITEYQPYYPPRIGMSVAWYSRYHPAKSHPMPNDPLARERLKEDLDRIHGLGIRRNARRHARNTMNSLSRTADGFFLDRQPDNGWEPFRDQFEGDEFRDHDSEKADGPGDAGRFLDPSSRDADTSPREAGKMRAVPLVPAPPAEPETPHPVTADQHRPTIRGQSPGSELWPPAGTYGAISEDRNRRSALPARKTPVRTAQREYPGNSARFAGRMKRTPPRSHPPGGRRTTPVQQTAGEALGLAARVALRAKQQENGPSVPLPRHVDQEPIPTRTSRITTAPIMSYTRIFDAADSDLVAIWRDFLETTGDQRPAGWVAQLYWSDNFLRFTARLMISEMFQLHGGEAKRRIILKLRKHR